MLHGLLDDEAGIEMHVLKMLTVLTCPCAGGHPCTFTHMSKGICILELVSVLVLVDVYVFTHFYSCPSMGTRTCAEHYGANMFEHSTHFN